MIEGSKSDYYFEPLFGLLRTGLEIYFYPNNISTKLRVRNPISEARIA
jgi:hypothetical protein